MHWASEHPLGGSWPRSSLAEVTEEQAVAVPHSAGNAGPVAGAASNTLFTVPALGLAAIRSTML